MAKVIGVGGIFFKSKDGKKLGAWYRKNLGVDVQAWGGAVFPWEEKPSSAHQRFTVWNPFAKDTKHFAPSREPYMINFIVDDLGALIAKLRKARVKIDANPGRITQIHVSPTREGTFEIACSQHCGWAHDTMRGALRVVPPADFDRWLEEASTQSSIAWDLADSAAHWGWPWD